MHTDIIAQRYARPAIYVRRTASQQGPSEQEQRRNTSTNNNSEGRKYRYDTEYCCSSKCSRQARDHLNAPEKRTRLKGLMQERASYHIQTERSTYRPVRRLPHIVKVSVGAAACSQHSAGRESSHEEQRVSVRHHLVLPTPAPPGLAIAGDDSPPFYRHWIGALTLSKSTAMMCVSAHTQQQTGLDWTAVVCLACC